MSAPATQKAGGTNAVEIILKKECSAKYSKTHVKTGYQQLAGGPANRKNTFRKKKRLDKRH